MRVVCDNCGASYKIPDSKLTRDVNKATCRKCGSPILIRRPDQAPAPEGDPQAESAADERTLITSAAELEKQARARATPPSDDGSMDPRPTQVSPDNSGAESTVPRAAPAAPKPEGGERDTVVQAPEPEPPPPFVPAASPFPPPPGGPPGAPPAGPSVGPPPPPAKRGAPPPRAPQPPPIAVRPPAAAPPPPAESVASHHDPRGDLTFAMLLAGVGLFGALIHVAGAFLVLSPIGAIGTFMSVFGCAGAALIILTGGRGVRPASIVLGVAGGFFLAVILGLAHFLAGGGLSAMGGPSPEVAPIARPVVAPPAEAAKPPVEAAKPPVEVATPPVEAAPPVAVPPLVEAPKAVAVAPKPVEAPKPAPAKAAPPPERIAPKPEAAVSKPKPAPAKGAEPADEGPSPQAATLDTRVIDTMMKNNKGVKLCYIKEQKASGDFPSGVKVKMTVQTSGSVSSAKIPSGDWKGTDFDACLSSAVKAIAFPPFEGDPLSLTYAFPNF